MNDVFAKTGKGQEEIKTRATGLSQRVRQVLIFVDGKRDVSALRKLLVTDDLTDTLQMLQQQGYIEATAIAGQCFTEPASVSVNTMPSPTGIVFRELPPTLGTKELELARNFMVNTLKSFTGLYASLTLIEKVSSVQSHAEIRTYFEPWINAIIETRDGKRRSNELRRALLEII